jgi:hypothetical protein
MQQGRAASTAGIIHRVLARVEYGRSVQNNTDCGCDDYFKADFTNGHDVLPNLQAGALPKLSAIDAWQSRSRPINFYVLDEITNELYLCGCVRNFSICEFFLDQDRQFNNIQQVESEIVPEV